MSEVISIPDSSMQFVMLFISITNFRANIIVHISTKAKSTHADTTTYVLKSHFVLNAPGIRNTSGSNWQTASRVTSPLEVLSRPPSLRDPIFLWGCDWTGVSLCSMRIIALGRCHLSFRRDIVARSHGKVLAHRHACCSFRLS